MLTRIRDKMFEMRIKVWGFEKKRKAPEMAAASRIIERRRRQGKATELRIRGELIDEAEIRRYDRRKGLSKRYDPANVDDATTPPSITYATPRLTAVSTRALKSPTLPQTSDQSAP